MDKACNTKADKTHVSDGSRGGGKVDLGFPSSCVSHMGEDRGLLERMDGLEKNMKLIMTALNIGGMENRWTTNEDVGAAGRNSHTENLVNNNTNVEPYINSTQPDVTEDEIIIGAKIVVKVD